MIPGAAIAAALVAGLAAIAVGLRLLRRAQADPIPEHTGPRDRREVLERAVYLAVELARADGAISEIEMACIERVLVDRFELAPDDATALLRQMLRATQHDAGARSALGDIARLADAPLRADVVALLQATAEAGAGVNEAERVRLEQVRKRLGVG